MTLMDISNLAFLIRRSWWHDSFFSALSYAPHCLIPACCLAASNVAMFLGTRQFYRLMQMQQLQIEQFAHASMQTLWCFLAALVLLSFALTVLLFKLTAIARARLKSAGSPDQKLLSASLTEVGNKKWYLFKLWSAASAYLLIPLFPFSLLSTVKILSSSSMSVPIADSALSMWSYALVNAGLFFVAAIMTGYCFSVLVLSASTLSSAGETAWRALRIFAGQAIPLILASSLVLFVTTFICAPQVLFSNQGPESMLKSSLPAFISWQVWFAFAGSIACPWSVIVFCHLLGERIRSPRDAK